MLAIAGFATACLPPPPPPSPPPKPPVLDAACAHTLVVSTPGTVASDAITEASGIAASRRADGVWWVHNDSGDRARVFAVSGSGQTLGEYAFTGASAGDWEDIAVGPGPSSGVSYLYVGDIGDNAKSRVSVQVYRVAEVDRAHPLTSPSSLAGVATVTQVATVSLGALQGVTAADITPAGDVVALRTYFGVHLYPHTSGTTIALAFSQAECAGRDPVEAAG